MQRLEVRAFGYLLEELIERCEVGAATDLGKLEALAAACLSENIKSRPTFEAITAQLKAWTS